MTENKEEKATGITADAMILGENAVFSIDSRLTGLNNNVLVEGSSGSGKTWSITEPQLLQTVWAEQARSLLVSITKRRIYQAYRRSLWVQGYAVDLLNFVRPQESTIGYDPLQYVCSYEDITFLAASIVKADPHKDKSNADPYWDQASISLLSALIAYVMMVDQEATLADVLALHDELEVLESGSRISTTLDPRFDALEKIAPRCFAMTCWKTFRQLPIKTASCIVGTLNAAIDSIFTPELRHMMKIPKKVDFEQIASKKSVLFIMTSAVNPALHCFINIFYAQAFKTLFEFAEDQPDGRLPVPVHMICDDFATGGRVLNFPEYISIFREKQISVTLLIQSESQLASMYGDDDAVTIINNCDTIVYMGGMDLRTCRNISERLNAPLDEVLYMPVGQEIVFRRGQRPLVTSRYRITGDWRYQKIIEENKGEQR